MKVGNVLLPTGADVVRLIPALYDVLRRIVRVVDGTSDTVASLETSVDTINATQFSFRNKLINGNFDIWQRGPSGAYMVPIYVADRWKSTHVAGTLAGTSAERQTFSPGQTDVPGNPKYFLRRQRTSGTSVTVDELHQAIESITTLAGKTVTLSFYTKADAARTLDVGFQQYFGAGGTPSAPVSVTRQAVSVTTAWQKFTLTFAIPSIAGKTFGTTDDGALVLQFAFPLGSNYTIDIAQVQLEEGNVATPFEQRPLGLELSLCQRYYENSFYPVTAISTNGYVVGSWNRAGGASVGIRFAVTKRAAPTVTIYSPTTGAAGKVRDDSAATDVAVAGMYGTGVTGVLVVSGASTVGNVCLLHYTADAEL